MVNFGTRCTDEWVHFDLKNNFVSNFLIKEYCLKIFCQILKRREVTLLFYPSVIFQSSILKSLPREFACMFEEADKNQDGRIDFEEFQAMMLPGN